MTEKKYASLGPISSRTMRSEDLIPAFEEELMSLGFYPFRTNLAKRFLEGEDLSSEDLDEVYDYEQELIDRLLEFAPPFCYFGSHPGDGADYGFWFDNDSYEEAVRDQRIITVIDLSHVALMLDLNEDTPIEIVRDYIKEFPPEWEYVSVVSYDRNITLYSAFDLENPVLEMV